jgi:hypothetical protein
MPNPTVVAAKRLGDDPDGREDKRQHRDLRVQQRREVEVGARDGEEERYEDRGQWLEVALQLVGRLGLGGDQASHERADDRGEADGRRQQRHREHEQERRDEGRVGEQRPREHA